MGGRTVGEGDTRPAACGDVLAQGRLQQSIAATLLVIAAARAERQAAPVHAARQRLAAVYGATRLRGRREGDTPAG